MASELFILDLNGKKLVSRDYRGNTPKNVYQKFVKYIVNESEETLKPIFTLDEFSFIHIKNDSLYCIFIPSQFLVVLVAKNNCNTVMLTDFLWKLVEVLKNYFGEVDEESIKDNFVTVYELLDEMMDFGLPQTTETDLLKDFIKVESHKIDKLERISWEKGFLSVVQGLSEMGKESAKNFLQKATSNKEEDTSSKLKVPTALTNAVSWRKDGIFYKENKIYLDVIEAVNLIVGSDGKTIQSDILGTIKVNCELSGMPELKLGLNDKVLFEALKRDLAKAKTVDLEDVKFHQCVQLGKFTEDRTITFTPPDGNFVLMSYRLDQKVKPLVHVESRIMPSSSKIEYTIRAKAQFKSDSTASEVQVHVPVPKDCSNPQFAAAHGAVKYIPEKDVICWTLTNFQGGKDHVMTFIVELPSVKNEEDVKASMKKPIIVKFQIPYYTVSGLQVRYLKIQFKKGDYQALPWVRYYTQSENCQIRQNN